MIKVKRVDIPLFKGLGGTNPTSLQPIEDAVNKIGQNKILYITCASSYPGYIGTYSIFYNED